jgi:hypothetical protein
MSKIVKQGQGFVDKVVELTGSFDNVVAMAVINDKSITEPLIIGEELESINPTNKRVTNFFNKYNQPATGMTQSQIDLENNIGIGEMIIATTFIVE